MYIRDIIFPRLRHYHASIVLDPLRGLDTSLCSYSTDGVSLLD